MDSNSTGMYRRRNGHEIRAGLPKRKRAMSSMFDVNALYG